MPDISKITLPSGNTYDIKDAVAREMISGGVSFSTAWDGTSAPTVSAIPAGVVVTYNGTQYTGTLAANDAIPGSFYLVRSQTQTGETTDAYDEYVPVGPAGSKTWEKIGDTQVDLSDVVTGVELNKQTDVVLGEGTTFTNASSSVTFGALTGHTDTVLGTGSTFTVTQPTITVTPSTTNIKATASGTAISASGTTSVLAGYNSPTTDTFVKSVSAETGKNLVTTTVPNITSAGSASTWNFAMGSGTASETLIISGANSVAPTLGTAITAATGQTSESGTGSAVVTGVTVGSSASAITGLGTPSKTSLPTGFTVTQPTISLATGATAGTGVISVATGISSATASGTAVSASGDNVTAVVSMPTATAAAQKITVGTNDKVTTLKSDTSLNVTKGSATPNANGQSF